MRNNGNGESVSKIPGGHTKKVREALKLEPGQQLHVYVLDDVIPSAAASIHQRASWNCEGDEVEG